MIQIFSFLVLIQAMLFIALCSCFHFQYSLFLLDVLTKYVISVDVAVFAVDLVYLILAHVSLLDALVYAVLVAVSLALVYVVPVDVALVYGVLVDASLVDAAFAGSFFALLETTSCIVYDLH